MPRLTYAQVRSTAISLVKEFYKQNVSQRINVLIYKDYGGCYQYKILKDGCNICYTSFKAIVHVDDTGNIVTEVSRETISKFLEEYNINFIYFQLD